MPAGRGWEFVSVPANALQATTGFRRLARGFHRRLRWIESLIALVTICCVVADAQSAQYARYHNNHRNRAYGAGVYGGGGYRGPGTAQSAAQFGMARVISATGNANLMNSVAIIETPATATTSSATPRRASSSATPSARAW